MSTSKTTSTDSSNTKKTATKSKSKPKPQPPPAPVVTRRLMHAWTPPPCPEVAQLVWVGGKLYAGERLEAWALRTVMADGQPAATEVVGLVAAPGGSLTVAEDDPTHMGWLRDGEAVADLEEVPEE